MHSSVPLVDMTDDQHGTTHRRRVQVVDDTLTREHEQLIALRKENHQLQLQLHSDQQRTQRKKKQYEDRVHESDVRCHDLTDLIRKLQHHLRISQEKLSEKAKLLLEKDDTLRHYQVHIGQLNHRIKQLTNDSSLAAVRRRKPDRPLVDSATQTSPVPCTQRRSVRFHIDVDPRIHQ